MRYNLGRKVRQRSGGGDHLVRSPTASLPLDRLFRRGSWRADISSLSCKHATTCLATQRASSMRLRSPTAPGFSCGMYGTALRQHRPFSDEPSGSRNEQQPVKVVPKGLRAFDEHDADFFLDLLPGPRRESGLPESIHFWKVRIEETDTVRTFAVGVVYGPSGCGKSSLVKAGLLPRLGEAVVPIYIEATAGET